MSTRLRYSVGSQAISLVDSEGHGPPIVLIHGNSSSADAFLPQFASALAEDFRLVAIDLPGHGDSDPAANPVSTYSLPGYAAILCECVENLRLRNAVIVGWSLGGHIALEASPRLHTAAGFMIFGAPPLSFPPDTSQAFLANPAVNFLFQAELSDADIECFARAHVRSGAQVPRNFVADIKRTHRHARVSLGASISTVGFADEIEIVKVMHQPLAVLHGADEGLVNGAYLQGVPMPSLWRGQIQIIEDAGHAPQWEQPGEFNRLLREFAQDCNA
jgi:pimeloyl-ACP methyl ester carboxylesterase